MPMVLLAVTHFSRLQFRLKNVLSCPSFVVSIVLGVSQMPVNIGIKLGRRFFHNERCNIVKINSLEKSSGPFSLEVRAENGSCLL